eukprot:TRINITY_DN15941_c0_g1_i1.p1 TRINITY_DN15941_c0_g1~~TRINITY_DN15941_c0_g1_i1.p1  ORF type:complete len:400 (+),score=25.07 TRINITY_DN15941_c0_g1_i1:329-1528(+)
MRASTLRSNTGAEDLPDRPGVKLFGFTLASSLDEPVKNPASVDERTSNVFLTEESPYLRTMQLWRPSEPENKWQPPRGVLGRSDQFEWTETYQADIFRSRNEDTNACVAEEATSWRGFTDAKFTVSASSCGDRHFQRSLVAEESRIQQTLGDNGRGISANWHKRRPYINDEDEESIPAKKGRRPLTGSNAIESGGKSPVDSGTFPRASRSPGEYYQAPTASADLSNCLESGGRENEEEDRQQGRWPDVTLRLAIKGVERCDAPHGMGLTASANQMVRSNGTVPLSGEAPPEDDPAPALEVKVYGCSFCNRSFGSPQALGGHQNSHSRQRVKARRAAQASRSTFLLPSRARFLSPRPPTPWQPLPHQPSMHSQHQPYYGGHDRPYLDRLQQPWGHYYGPG